MLLGALPLDRVEQRAPQHFGFDPTLDQVVLRAGGHRRHPEVLVVQPREHHDRDAGGALPDALQCVDPVGVGEVQIQQHTVRLGQHQLTLGVGHRLRPRTADVGGSVGNELFDQHRVCPVVFYKKDRQPALGLSAG